MSGHELARSEREYHCDICGKPMVFVRENPDGTRLWNHRTKAEEKRCLRLWKSKLMAEYTERMFQNIERAKEQREREGA